MPKSSLQATSTQGSVSPAAELTASIMRLAALKLSALEESNRKAATSHLHMRGVGSGQIGGQKARNDGIVAAKDLVIKAMRRCDSNQTR